MNINGQHYQSIWLSPDDPTVVQTIDQRVLPNQFLIVDLKSYHDGVFAIQDMIVRGAPLIGATAAWSLYLAALEAESTDNPDEFIITAAEEIAASRPTAVNLRWAVDNVLAQLQPISDANQRIEVARAEAEKLCLEDIESCRQIGQYGLPLLEKISSRKKGEAVNILTHCNAGWIATIDHGTATSPIYQAHDRGIPVHVWVDETRPRNQGSQLTVWELAEHGVPHTLIVDNAGGHLMQQGKVDICITGTDRTARNGDVGNKIGTYLKALAAHDNSVPFYVAAPSSSIDWGMEVGTRDMVIEERAAEEVTHVSGISEGKVQRLRIVPEGTLISNYAFDVTPARLVTGLITERGICAASESGLRELFPERFAAQEVEHDISV